MSVLELKRELDLMYGELGNLEEERLVASEVGDDNWVVAVSAKIRSLVSDIVNAESYIDCNA